MGVDGSGGVGAQRLDRWRLVDQCAKPGLDGSQGARINLSVVLPVYNEAATVGSIIDDVLALDLPDIDIELIIVESNSSDGSRDVVAGYADHPRVKLVYQDRPSGKGSAVRAGFCHAAGDILLIQDADLEYRVEEYPIVLAPLIANEANFVLGCRHSPGKAMRHFEAARHMSWLMNGAHWAFTTMFNVVYRTKLRDPFTMYKVFRTSCIVGVPFTSNRFDFDWELVAKLVRLGNIPLEVPITYVSRDFDSGKKVRFFRDPLTWMVALAKFRFTKLTAADGDPTVALPRMPVRSEPAPLAPVRLEPLHKGSPNGAAQSETLPSPQAANGSSQPEDGSASATSLGSAGHTTV
ncbi:MAG: glycosyltransferase [Actinobacteria bacterium]|nr:glycosyltransferase [Actinomycetota bacterium]